MADVDDVVLEHLRPIRGEADRVEVKLKDAILRQTARSTRIEEHLDLVEN